MPMDMQHQESPFTGLLLKNDYSTTKFLYD